MAVSDNSRQTDKGIPDEIIESVARFPNMPQAGIKLRALLTEKEVSIDEIEKILRHDPEGKKNSNLHPEIVYLANLLCQSNSASGSAEEQDGVPYPSVLNRLGLMPEQYKVFAEKARDWMKKLSDTLTFD